MRNYVVIPLYWGNAFLPANAKSFSLFDMNGAILEIMNSPYVSGMAEYGVGPSQFHPTVDVAPGELPVGASFTDDQIATLLVGEIDATRAPGPDTFADGLIPFYFVFVRQGLFSSDHSNDVGYHYSFTYKDKVCPCAWVMQGADLDGTTPIFAHEFAEGACQQEVGDPCNGENVRLGHYMVQKYFSKLSNSCIDPRRRPLQNSTNCIARNSDHLDCFWVGPDGAIATTRWDASVNSANWQVPFPLSPPRAARSDSPVVAVSRSVDHLDVFWIGPDGAIATTWWDAQIDSAQWHSPFPLTPPGAAGSGSPLSAISRVLDHLDVFWTGPDGAVATTWSDAKLDNAQWHTPFPISPPGAARVGSPLVAISRIPEHLDLYWLGRDGALGTTWWDQNIDQARWHDPFPLTPPGAASSASPLTTLSRIPERLEVFWIRPDGAVATTWSDQNIDKGQWHTPSTVTPPGAASATSPLAACGRAPDHLDLFWLGTDQAVGTTWWDQNIDNAQWHTPFPLTPPGAAASGSFLSALTRMNDHLDLFWRGPDGAIGATWWDAHMETASWHTPFPITPPKAVR